MTEMIRAYTHLFALRNPALHYLRCQLIRNLLMPLCPVRAATNDTNVGSKESIRLELARVVRKREVAHVDDDRLRLLLLLLLLVGHLGRYP